MKKGKDTNIYIEAINFGKNRLHKKLTTRKMDLDQHLKSKGFDVPDGTFLDSIFLDIFGTQFMRNKSLSGEPSYLNSEAYFNLLDYEELQHARKSSKEAKKIAIWAIGISGCLALFSIILTSYEVLRNNSKIYINQEQFNELKQTITNIGN